MISAICAVVEFGDMMHMARRTSLAVANKVKERVSRRPYTDNKTTGAEKRQ